jgi:serine/threonine-protein kinase HipA
MNAMQPATIMGKSTMDNETRLLVQYDNKTAGFIYPSKNSIFEYSKEWVKNNYHPISISMSTSRGFFNTSETQTFLENLMPEGSFLDTLCYSVGISNKNPFDFFHRFGKECAGALSIFPEDQLSDAQTSMDYRDITLSLQQILSKRLVDVPNLIAATNARISLAGAQNKLAVKLENGHCFVPAENSFSPTDHILKMSSGKYENLVLNELFCLELAKEIGLPAVDAIYQKIADKDVLFLKRYDRVEKDGKLIRLHQEDFCQALGCSNIIKYEDMGGPNISECLRLFNNPSFAKADKAKNIFIDSIIFNYIIGNCDGHSKNYSLLYDHNALTSKNNSFTLSPIYDVLCTLAYPELTSNMAFSIGGEQDIKNINVKNWHLFAERVRLGPESLKERCSKITSSIDNSLNKLIDKHENIYGAKDFYDKLAVIIHKQNKDIKLYIDEVITALDKATLRM